MYTPHPIDTSDVTLPAELKALADALAKNVHEVWAQTRIDQGWVYGPERNDERKEHPGIVEYEELTEEEKVFDHNTALSTLRLIKKLGFDIVKR